ncbi:MAG: glycosyltransferase family 4 protein [Patescibacteria group bacterium]
MERHGLILSKEQIKLGHQVDVFIGFGDENLLPNIRKAPFQFLPIYSKIRRFWFNFWAFRQIKKRHQKNPYDIIHLHGDFIEAFFSGKLSKKLSIPAVMTVHAGLNKRLLKPKNAEYFKNIGKIICVSNEIAEDLKSIGIQERKIEIITSGIYLSEFGNADKNGIVKLRDKYSQPIIVSVGVLRINKGFTYLIEAFKRIKEKIGSASLIIIGEGPEGKNLEKQASDISGIYFLGRQEHDKVIEYLKTADIFVLASISTSNDREGMPTSIMEAMAAGLPVVATKVGGNPDFIKDGINGFIVNQGNSLEISQAVLKILSDNELFSKIRAQNLEDIKQKNWPIIAKLIDEVYESVLQNP